MTDARIIVCEKTGKWATSLRMVLSDLQDQIRETRSLVDMLREAESSPASLIAMELSVERLETQLCCLLELSRRFPRIQTVVLTDRGSQKYEPLVREAGAVHFLSSPRDVLALGRLIRRHLASASQDQAHGLHREIWDRLPWGPE